MGVGQLIVHEKARIIFTDILNHVGGVSPVAKTGAARRVHQIPAAGAQGKGRKKYRLAFEAFYFVESGFNSCAQAGERIEPISKRWRSVGLLA